MDKEKTYSNVAIKLVDITALSLKLTALAFSIVTMLCIMLLAASSAYAQGLPPLPGMPGEPNVRPSNEMEFDMTPQPTIAESGTNGDLENEFDQMLQDDSFASDPMIDISVQPPLIEETPEATPEPEGTEKKAKKKKRRTKYAKKVPPYNYKSWRLPDTIYSTSYSRGNQHLPKAIYEKDLQTRLQLATIKGDITVMRTLMQHGVNLNLRDDFGTPLLITALKHGQLHTAEWLLAKGASPEQTDSNGYTALHYTSFNSSAQATKLLLSYGANPNSMDARGTTPHNFAMNNGSYAVSSMLEKHGANPNL